MNPVYLIGAGPGSADLITLRGAKILGEASMVFHDALIGDTMFALAPQATWVAVGKRAGKHSLAQVNINARIIQAALAGEKVVRLKGGDAMLFGRADEEIRALDLANIPVEVVPGITAASAASAGLKQSLTLRKVARSVAYCTFASSDPYEEMVVPSADSLVIYMGRNDCASIARRLLAESWQADTPTVMIQAISMPKERRLVLSLQALAQGGAQSWLNGDLPTLILLGAAFANAIDNPSQLAKSFFQGSMVDRINV